MKFLIIIVAILFCSSLSFAQKDSSKFFESSKGKWPLPVPKYIKIYDNETLKRRAASVFDSTLRIITDSSYNVTAVHAGKIIAIIEIENEYTIVTKFGKYFVCYSRLTKPDFKQGEFIYTGQVLGKVIKDWSEENYTLEIMLTKNSKQLSAEKWIDW